MDREQGITFARMFSLIDLHKKVRARELHELGTIMSLAFSDPSKLKDLLPRKQLDMSKLPAMMRIPEKRHG